MKIQIDGPDILSSTAPVFTEMSDFQLLDSYEPGKNGHFCPAGRTSWRVFEDLLVMAKSLADHPDLHRADWIHTGQNGAEDSDHFVSFGPAYMSILQIYHLFRDNSWWAITAKRMACMAECGICRKSTPQIVHAVTATPQPPKPYHAGPLQSPRKPNFSG